jgi:hypothetical protein
VRSARDIRREVGRLTPEEIQHLTEYVQGTAPHMLEVLHLPTTAPVKQG